MANQEKGHKQDRNGSQMQVATKDQTQRTHVSHQFGLIYLYIAN